MVKRPRYSDDFRADAVLMFQAQGGFETSGALEAVANYLKIPARTLSRWAKGQQNPPPDQLVAKKKGELVDQLGDILQKLVDEIDQAIPGASLNQLATTFGIMFDKRRLLQGQTTAEIGIGVSDEFRRNVESLFADVVTEPAAGDSEADQAVTDTGAD